MDRVFVRGEIALGIGFGHRCLTQHIERIRVAACFALARIRERLIDRTPGNELPAQQAHRQIHAFANERFAALTQERSQRLLERSFIARIDDPAGDEKAPRGRVDE